MATLMDKRKQEPFWLVTDGRRYEDEPVRLGLLLALVVSTLCWGVILYGGHAIWQAIRP